MQHFGDFVRRLRINKKLTQTQLAAKLEIDAAALSKIENGKMVLNAKKLPILSNVFGLKLDNLRVEYFGEKIANELYLNECPKEVFSVAETKYGYLENNENGVST